MRELDRPDKADFLRAGKKSDAMRVSGLVLQLAKYADNLCATEQVVTGAGVDLTIANLKRQKIPHLEVAKGPLLWIAAKPRGNGTEKLHVAVFVADPARMIHMCGQAPFRGPSPTALIVGNDVPKAIPLELYMRNFPQLGLDLRSHRIFVKGSGRLVRQRFHDCEDFLFTHLA